MKAFMSLAFCFSAMIACVAATGSMCPSDVCKGKKDGDYANPPSMNQHYYVTCSNGLTHCRPCPAGLVWNDANKQCDYTSPNAKPVDASNCPDPDYCIINNLKPGSYADPNSIHYYIVCVNKQTYCMPCPDQTIWNDAKKICDWPPHKQSGNGMLNADHCPPDFCKGKKDGDYANPANMSQHYYVTCSNGLTHCRPCPAGLVWNDAKKQCDYPPTAKPVDASQCPTNNFCAGKTNGLYPNPSDLDQHFFISCSNGLTYCFECAAHLTYDDKTKRCEY